MSRERSECNPIVEISIPSITMLPPAASIILKSERVRLDLPAPVRPTIPTFSSGLTEKVMPFRTRSRPSR